MTVLRWFVLLLTLLPAVVSPGFAMAQDADATPTIPSGTLVAAVTRQFDRNGLALVGPIAIRTFVAVYNDANVASMALPQLVHQLRDQMAGPDGGDMRLASTPKIGDERLAYAGPVMANEQEAQAGVFGWRDGRHIYVLVDVGLTGDMLEPLFGIASLLSGRALPESEAVQATEEGEMSRGGPFELLPTLDDMPPGWVFSEDADLTDTFERATPVP